jgi:hypothetical protein
MRDQLFIALDAGEDGAAPDDERNSQPGQVLSSVVAVRVFPGGLAPGDAKANEDDDRGRNIRQVVERIAQQRHGARIQRNQQLDGASGGQSECGNEDGPISTLAVAGLVMLAIHPESLASVWRHRGLYQCETVIAMA